MHSQTASDVVARRAPIPLFGAGLVEAIPDDTLLALEDPFDRDGNGVSGRAAVIVDVATGTRRVGRFGWKAQQATLLAFSGDAYRNEMGITNDLFPRDYALGISDEAMKRCDVRPEPEDVRDPLTRRRGIDNFESFMRFLAPVGRALVDDTVRDGERSFRRSAAPRATSPRSRPDRAPIRSSIESPFRSFQICCCTTSGPATAFPQAAARPEEIRTPALWGLRLRRPLLHDGSAATIEDAIDRHQREGELARKGVAGLRADDHARLMAFLRSL